MRLKFNYPSLAEFPYPYPLGYPQFPPSSHQMIAQEQSRPFAPEVEGW
jgi:hypothetical protein